MCKQEMTYGNALMLSCGAARLFDNLISTSCARVRRLSLAGNL